MSGDATHGHASVGKGSADDEPRAWRERVLGGLLWTVAAAFLCVSPWTIVRHVYGEGSVWLYIGLGLSVTVAALARRRLSYAVGATVLLTAITIAAANAIVRSGYAPNAFTTASFGIVVATLLLGVRGGLALVLLFTALLGLTPTFHRGDGNMRLEAWVNLHDSANPDSALRVATIFVILSGASVIATAYLLRRGDQLLHERTLSLEQLAREQAEKERVQRDLALREAAFRKAAELEILGRLSGCMAHDFNNALLVIFAALDQLSHAELAPELREAVDALQTAATHAASATRQLRAFGPQAPTAPAKILLGAAARRLAGLLRRVLPSNVALSLEVEGEPAIVADEAEIQRILTNLVLNARDAMREGGTVTLRVEPSTLAGAPCARMVVRDDGAGMTEEVRLRLFEPFFTTKGGAGTGLGLASVRELTEAAGGRVSVESELGVGSSVSVYWPLAAAEPESRARAVPGGSDGHGINVLLVDDDAQVRALLARGLRRLGFTVVEAADGSEALTLIRRHREPLHVLCSDCIMPGVPLRELIAAFRAAYPDGRVLLCSGYAPHDAGIAPGVADTFLSKPFRLDELAARIVELHRAAARPQATLQGSASLA